MGCDFWWSGSIADERRQEEVIKLFRTLFDWRRSWTVLEPTADPQQATLFGDSPLANPAGVAREGTRIVEGYPFNYLGVAPYLRQDMTRNVMRRGQLVFDRNDGGRIVSVMPVNLMGDPGELPASRISAVLIPGGYVRILGELQCRALALFLNAIKFRYCPDLDVQDDRLYVETIAQELREKGRIVEITAETFVLPKFMNEYLREFTRFLHPEPWDGDTDSPERQAVMHFDFLPFLYAWRKWAMGIPTGSKDEWATFFHAYIPAVLRRAKVRIDADDGAAVLANGLRIALTRIWDEDGFAEIVTANRGSKDVLRVIHPVAGGNDVVEVKLAGIAAAAAQPD